MCGITAYCGKKSALPFLMHGLEKLEYRGYDSAGVAILEESSLVNVKYKGKLSNLKNMLENYDLNGHIGIGHTRWATHGVPSSRNSHPHCNKNETIALVHNGIIENYRVLKEELIKMGYEFTSDTDSEVIVHLIDSYYDGDLFKAVSKTLKRIEGSYALCIVSSYEPDKIIVAKKDSPLIIGKTDDAYVVASDIPALLDYTKDVYFLDDLEMAIIFNDHVDFYNQDGQMIDKEPIIISYDLALARKDGFDSFMLKEMHEQPHVIEETLRGRLHHNTIHLEELDGIDFTKFNQVYFVACGTAYHACLCGAKILQTLTQLPVICSVASEFRYDQPYIDEKTLAVFVSQSGETADTLAALRLAKEKHATTIAIANVVGSHIAREASHVLYTCAGPEIAVASTKAYTTQLILLTLLACDITKRLQKNYDLTLIEDIQRIPSFIKTILQDKDIFQEFTHLLDHQKDCYFIGRGLDYASVLEGALKLKEVSYVHADAYIAGELKHGPIALIEEGSVVIAVATQPHIASKTMSNIQETIARGARVILLTTHDQDSDIKDQYILPHIHPLLQPILVSIPLQFIAYYTATFRGCDVDKPRNLAKSVTVE